MPRHFDQIRLTWAPKSSAQPAPSRSSTCLRSALPTSLSRAARRSDVLAEVSSEAVALIVNGRGLLRLRLGSLSALLTVTAEGSCGHVAKEHATGDAHCRLRRSRQEAATTPRARTLHA